MDLLDEENRIEMGTEMFDSLRGAARACARYNSGSLESRECITVSLFSAELRFSFNSFTNYVIVSEITVLPVIII